MLRKLLLACGLAIGSLGLGATAQASDYDCCPCGYRVVVCYENRVVCCTRWVTCYDSCGCPYQVKKTYCTTVVVPVRKYVKVCY